MDRYLNCCCRCCLVRFDIYYDKEDNIEPIIGVTLFKEPFTRGLWERLKAAWHALKGDYAYDTWTELLPEDIKEMQGILDAISVEIEEALK